MVLITTFCALIAEEPSLGHEEWHHAREISYVILQVLAVLHLVHVRIDVLGLCHRRISKKLCKIPWGSVANYYFILRSAFEDMTAHKNKV